MSLDVHLFEADKGAASCACAGVCPCHTMFDEVYSANITHNLGGMAREGGIYQACWRPEEIAFAISLNKPFGETSSLVC